MRAWARSRASFLDTAADRQNVGAQAAGIGGRDPAVIPAVKIARNRVQQPRLPHGAVAIAGVNDRQSFEIRRLCIRLISKTFEVAHESLGDRIHLANAARHKR